VVPVVPVRTVKTSELSIAQTSASFLPADERYARTYQLFDLRVHPCSLFGDHPRDARFMPRSSIPEMPRIDRVCHPSGLNPSIGAVGQTFQILLIPSSAILFMSLTRSLKMILHHLARAELGFADRIADAMVRDAHRKQRIGDG